jgi:uncharacterized protein YaaQ
MDIHKDIDGNMLMIVIVQAQDAENAESALEEIDVTVTRVSSLGGFLGRRNMTLLVNLSKKNWQPVIDILHDQCRQRVEYIAVPMESAPLPLPTPTPITIGGATIFGLEIEQIEVI